MGSHTKDKQRGFSLIEVMVSVVLLSLLGASIVPSFLKFLKFNSSMEITTKAISAAQIVLEQSRLADPSMMPSSGSSSPVAVTVDGSVYDVTTSFCEVSSYCSGDTRHLAVDVSYNNKLIYEVETVYTKLR